MPRLAILDQSIAVEGRPHSASIQDTIALARHCEELGYHRFWVSEHHNHPTIVGTAPEILIAAIAQVTSRIRIGSAGVMLPHYSAFKVAEQFRVLDALAPGRIDLGLGRAPGSDGRTAFALHPLANQRAAQFPSDVSDLIAWISDTALPEDHVFASLKVHPMGPTVPEVWMLGSSGYGAQVGAHFGLPYSFAWFFTDGQGGREAIAMYRDGYQPSERHPEPVAGICVWALVAESEEEALFHYASRVKFRIHRDRGVFVPFEPAEVAMDFLREAGQEGRIEQYRRHELVGAAPQVAARIRALAGELEVDEVAIVTWTHDEAARRRSYALLAREFGLPGSGAAEAALRP